MTLNTAQSWVTELSPFAVSKDDFSKFFLKESSLHLCPNYYYGKLIVFCPVLCLYVSSIKTFFFLFSQGYYRHVKDLFLHHYLYLKLNKADTFF